MTTYRHVFMKVVKGQRSEPHVNFCLHPWCSLFLFTFSFYISFPLRNVRSKCECAHTMRVGMVLIVRPYIYHIYVYGDRYTRVREAIQILPPSISEGGSLHSPINTLTMVYVTIFGKTNQLARIQFYLFVVIFVQR